jgi:hypothetical protein
MEIESGMSLLQGPLAFKVPRLKDQPKTCPCPPVKRMGRLSVTVPPYGGRLIPPARAMDPSPEVPRVYPGFPLPKTRERA